MSHNKHTPGPWIIHPDKLLPDGTEVHSITADTIFTRFICHCEGEGRTENARLITAGPDMLAALESLVNHNYQNYRFESDGKLGEALKFAREAISKAKGEA